MTAPASCPDLDAHLPAIVAGDEHAFARWLAAAEAPLRRSLRAFAKAVDAESVVQETLLRCWHVAPTLAPDGQPNGLLRLALRIARNLAISQWRRYRTSASVLAELAAAAARSDAELAAWQPPDVHLRERIAECRGKLPSQPARALAARLDDAGALDDRGLAARVGMQLNTFLQNITRARQLLARCLRLAGIELGEEVA